MLNFSPRRCTARVSLARMLCFLQLPQHWGCAFVVVVDGTLASRSRFLMHSTTDYKFTCALPAAELSALTLLRLCCRARHLVGYYCYAIATASFYRHVLHVRFCSIRPYEIPLPRLVEHSTSYTPAFFSKH